jgi:hypothetical protein
MELTLQEKRFVFDKNDLFKAIFSSYYFGNKSNYFKIYLGLKPIYRLLIRQNCIENGVFSQPDVSRLQEVAMNQDQAFTNINKTFN